MAARTLSVIGALALIIGVAATVARSVPGGTGGDVWAMLTTFTDFGLSGYVVAVVCFGVALALRFRPAALVALVLSVVLGALHASWIVPRYVGDGESAVGTGRVSVLSENLMLGEADPEAVVANAQAADVLVVVEVTQAAADGLQQYGIGRRFPYEAGGTLPDHGAHGTRIYSRFPISSSGPLTPAAENNWLARVDVPDLGPVAVVAVHPVRPIVGDSRWWTEQEMLVAALPQQRAIAAGDFNAVDSHPSLRQLRESGVRGADEIVGAGWQPTFPAQGGVPPLIMIDHILLSPDLTATAFRTVVIDGSDHRGVLATIALRG